VADIAPFDGTLTIIGGSGTRKSQTACLELNPRLLAARCREGRTGSDTASHTHATAARMKIRAAVAKMPLVWTLRIPILSARPS